ncbi:ribosome-binding factor A [Psychrobacter sp. PL15]|jgi:ribosome-binding factor A|uniref:ribosome-binding factor A n=1 Tax=unclassified Psychrobacter TaxID=196806 RepID=UPI001AEAD082|nr:ribosome-binding factor A [Psychrobacter sp. PL15]MEC5209712.1 ribosome-binding factor A [Psychrobacter sp. PL15]
MNQRLQRLSDQIQRELAVLIRDEVNDPRLTGFVTISSVKVSPDLGYADIYVTIMESELNGGMNKTDHEPSVQVLNKAAGFLRTELSHSLKTRTTPRLRFHYDEVTARGNYMMDLISQAVTKTEQNEADEQAVDQKQTDQ